MVRAITHSFSSKRDRLKRVLYLVNLDPSLKFGSIEEQTLFLAKAFHERGGIFLPVFVSSMNEQDQAKYVTAGLRVDHLDLREFALSKLLRLIRLINHHKFEIVHWNFYRPINIYVLLLKLIKPNLRHYMTDHISRTSLTEGSIAFSRRWIKKILLRCYSKVLCISGFVLEDLRKQGIWGNLSRCHLFINTVRFIPDYPVRLQIRQSLGGQDRFIILTVANLIPEKGVEVVIAALGALPSHVVLWIVGDGPQLPHLEELKNQLQLNDRVVFYGLQRNVVPYMQAADCFVCPSLWGEALGLVILEAQACGLPVIASRVGGIPEFIEEGKTGFLFPPGDHAALAEKIKHLTSNLHLREAMGESARSMAVDRFSGQRRLSEELAIYEAAQSG